MTQAEALIEAFKLKAMAARARLDALIARAPKSDITNMDRTERENLGDWHRRVDECINTIEESASTIQRLSGRLP